MTTCSLDKKKDEDASAEPVFVLIDDDVLMRRVWATAAQKGHVRLLTFASWEAFIHSDPPVPRWATVYIDVVLDGNWAGQDVGEKLWGLGFQNLYLCTGHPASLFVDTRWSQRVVGKDPPF